MVVTSEKEEKVRFGSQSGQEVWSGIEAREEGLAVGSVGHYGWLPLNTVKKAAKFSCSC